MPSRISIALVASLLLVAGALLGTAHAANNCSGEQAGPGGQYSVDICISAPTPGQTLDGDVTVTATVTVTVPAGGTNPGIDSTSFRIRQQGSGGLGVYMLTDVSGTGTLDSRTYSFILPTYRWADNPNGWTIIAKANMVDGFTTTPGATVNDTFNNNGVNQWQTLPPFAPRTPAPQTPGHLIVTAAGDGAIDNQTASDVSSEISALNPDLFLYLGDVYNVGSMAEYYNWYGSRPGTPQCASLTTGCGNWGQFYSITDPAAGVHEYNAPPIQGQPATVETGYVDYWNMPTGTDPTTQAVYPHYYSYDDGGWHFISLDSTDNFRCRTDGSACADGGVSAGWNNQYNWLRDDLQNDTSACTIAYWHHPYWGMKSRDEDGVTVAGGVDVRLTDLYQLMYQQGVDILLTGHQHNFQRWKPLDASGATNTTNGITEIVDGAGGHPFGYFTRTDNRLVAGIDRNGLHVIQGGVDSGPQPSMTPDGVIRLDLQSGQADYRYVLAGANHGQTFDSASIPCHGAPADDTPPSQPSGLQATGNANKVDLTWDTPPGSDTDIAGYDIFRATGVPTNCTGSCVLVGSTNGTGTTFTDTHVNPSTVYTYAIRARDTSGNVSPESDSTTVSTATSSLFSDNFEAGTCSGPVTGWTKVSHMTKTPTTDGHGGACEADFQSTGTNIYASKTLTPAQSDLWAQAGFRLDSQATPVSILKLRNTATGTPFVYTAAVQKNGTLSGRNELLNETTKSSKLVRDGAWHLLTVHITTGATPNVDVYVDGSKVPVLSGANAVGSDPIGTVQIGDNAGNRTFSGALDDVKVDTNALSP